MHSWSRPTPGDPVAAGAFRCSTLLLPMALLLAITAVDVTTPTWLQIGPVFAAVPALAAAVSTVPATGAAAGLAFAVNAVLSAQSGGLDTVPFKVTCVALLTVTLGSLWACAIRQRGERRLTQVRSVAETAQRSLLHPLPGRVGALRLSGAYLAAEAEARIGGDFYEVLHTPFGIRVIIGDVRGKGLGAVGATAAVLGAFRETAYREGSLAEVARWLEESATRHIRQAYGEEFTERFATACLVEFPDEPVVRLVHCGHPEPLLIRDGRVEVWRPAEPGPPIGLAALVDAEPVVETAAFPPGSRMVLHTDGFVEARDSEGRFYPLAERMTNWAAAPMDRLVDRVRSDLLGHTGGDLEDDAALMVVERSQGPERPEVSQRSECPERTEGAHQSEGPRGSRGPQTPERTAAGEPAP